METELRAVDGANSSFLPDTARRIVCVETERSSVLLARRSGPRGGEKPYASDLGLSGFGGKLDTFPKNDGEARLGPSRCRYCRGGWELTPTYRSRCNPFAANKKERVMGLEPTTACLGSKNSTN